MLKVDEPDNAKPLASIAGIVVPEKVTVAPGKVGYGSFAATEMAPSAVAGGPLMYGLKPLLPADATTTTPAPAAFRQATPARSPFRPKAAPDPKLMTSLALF